MNKGFRDNTKGRRNTRQEKKRTRPRKREKKKINPLEVKRQAQGE